MAPILPLQLYRGILRAHRTKLPKPARELGDSYVKHEWRLHKGVTDGVIVTKFLTEWKGYLDNIAALPDKESVQKLKPLRSSQELLNQLSEEQVGQLYELMQAIKEEKQGKKK
ncbi:ACN9 domain-containing protein [Ascobolus immersus RN42]|uniref:Succinate dehydrogenase assembly factor 3 n=1 Tax=Ascobolus immersus RN42 TaxID=1160509 RepID=A0A3N4IPY2_ASCIM|nr:ACN9 domain-containing protein [Ascobolus immersus RN42]